MKELKNGYAFRMIKVEGGYDARLYHRSCGLGEDDHVSHVRIAMSDYSPLLFNVLAEGMYHMYTKPIGE